MILIITFKYKLLYGYLICEKRNRKAVMNAVSIVNIEPSSKHENNGHIYYSENEGDSNYLELCTVLLNDTATILNELLFHFATRKEKTNDTNGEQI